MLFKHLAFYIRDILLILSTDVIGGKDISGKSVLLNNLLYICYPDNEHPSIIDNIFKSDLSCHLLTGDLLNKLCKQFKPYECVNVRYRYNLVNNRVYTYFVETSKSMCTIMFFIGDNVEIIIMHDDVVKYNTMDKDKFAFSFNCLVECVKNERMELFCHYINIMGYNNILDSKAYILNYELNCFDMSDVELVECIVTYLNGVKNMYKFRKEYDEVQLIARLISSWSIYTIRSNTCNIL